MNTKIVRPTLLILAACAPVAPAFAQAPDAPPPAAVAPLPDGRVVLPEKTEVRLTLEKDLKSGADKAGQAVPYEVERDVFSPFPAHVLLIPAGAKAIGRVTQSRRRGMLGRSGKLEFTCEYVLAPGGAKVPLRSDPSKERGRSNTGTSVAVAVLAAPIALFMNGRDVTVHKGQEYVAYVDQDTALPDPSGLRLVPIDQGADPAAPTSLKIVPLDAPAPPAVAGATLFTLSDGSQVAGTIRSFDGTTYVVATATGDRSIGAASVKSMQALPGK